MRIPDREIGAGHPCFIAAEISGNHNGSLDRAIALINAADEAGADAVKFQAFSMDEILALRGTGQAPPPWESMTLAELYAKVITPREWFPTLFQEARSCGLIPFASVFGLESLAMLESLDCPAYKIAKPERNNRRLVGQTAAIGKPVLVSAEAWGDIYEPGDNVHAVFCPAGYPASRVKLGQMWRTGGWFVGLSCHLPDPLAGAVAIAHGAHYLEFHLTLADDIPTLDDCVNLNASQFRQMVQLVRRAEAML